MIICSFQKFCRNMSIPISVQRKYIFIEIHFIPVDLPDHGGFVIFWLLCASADGHRVTDAEIITPINTIALNRIRLGFDAV